MNEGTKPWMRPRLRLALFAALPLVGAASFYKYSDSAQHADSIKNYRIEWSDPKGWNAIPHSPQALFLFRHPDSNLLIRGATSQIVADFNPTPELDSDGLADFYIDITKDNMPGWTAKKSGSVECNGATFQIIRRERKGKCVLNAYGVKGNTTMLVTLSANGGETKHIDPAMKEFKGFLAQIKFVEQDMSDL